MSSPDRSSESSPPVAVTLEIDQLNERALQLERSAPAEMLALAKQAHQLAVEANYAPGIARSLASIGRAQLRVGDLLEAEQALIQAQAGDGVSPALEAELYNTRGNIYLYLMIYEKAFSFYQQSLGLARLIGDRELEARLLNNIGVIYRRHRDYGAALEHFRLALVAQDALVGFNAKSVPVGNMGLTYLEMGDLDHAESFSRQALALAEEQNDLMIESFALLHLGVAAKQRGQRQQAIDYLTESLGIYRRTHELVHAGQALIEFHKLYFEEGNTEMSLRYLQEALRVAKEGNSLASQLEVYSELAKVYDWLGDDKLALCYYRQYREANVALQEQASEQCLLGIKLQIAADKSLKESESYRQLSQELHQQTKELQEAYLTLQTISAIGKDITATLDLDQVFALVYERLPNLLETDAFGIGLYNAASDSLEYRYLMDEGQPLSRPPVSLSSTTSFMAACFRKRQGLMVNSLAAGSDYVDKVSWHGSPRMAALMMQPLIAEEEIIGVVMVQSRKENVYSAHTLDVLGMLASYLSIAIQNARRSDQLRDEIKQRQQAQEKLLQLNGELASLSNRDGLTNVANRRHFDQFLRHTWDTALRQRLPLSLLMIDIDCLKEYNDKYGHLSGDDVIKQIAQALQRTVKRNTDLVARFGGDEFTVLLGLTDAAGAEHVALEIKEEVERCAIAHGTSPVSPRVTISIGVATMIPELDDRPTDLVIKGDIALYQAKQAGRNRISRFKV